jgi:eukaryotic translation initiation factor 2-alpha kinase 4
MQAEQELKEMHYRARKRANSETTEIPLAPEVLTETFGGEIEMGGYRFDTVKLFHPRKCEWFHAHRSRDINLA